MVKALRALFILTVAALVLAGYRVLPGVQFDSDMMALFPAGTEASEVERANERMTQSAARKLYFLLASSDWQATQKAAASFAETLRLCDCTEQVVARRGAESFAELRDYYYQHPHVLLSDKDRILLQQGKPETLMTSTLREIAANAPSSEVDLSRDPLSTIDDFVASLRDLLTGPGGMENGYLYYLDQSTDRRYLMVVAELNASPYDLATQQTIDPVIDSAISAFRQAVPDADVVRRGIYFDTRAARDQAALEISTVAVGTLVGVVAIFILAFRSVSLFLITLIPIFAGITAGVIAATLVFGQIHIMALIFGSSLVGISIDYSLHFLCKRQAMGARWDPELGLRALMPGLTLGVLTSIAGYMSFVITRFPGLQQVAVFSCAGLAAAYLTVVGAYPWLLSRPTQAQAPDRAQRLIPDYFLAAYRHLRRIRHPELILPMVLLTGIGLWRLEFLDDVRALQVPYEQLQEEEARFGQLAGSLQAKQYLLVKADNQEALLQKLEQLKHPLQELRAATAVENTVNLTNWLPSQATQEENYTLIRRHLIETGLLAGYLGQLGLSAERQAQIVQSYMQPEDEWMTMDQTLPLLQHLLQRPLYFRFDDKHYSFILLEGLRNPAALAGLARVNENVFWVNRIATTNELLRQYRTSASWVLAGAYFLIWLMLIIRYGWRGAIALIAPPVLASLFAVVMLGWLGIGLSVFSVMALLLILGIGIDYALFLRESHGRGYDTLYAVGLASLTTLLSFALLSLSTTPAIAGFGLTAMLGIVGVFLLAPLSVSSSDVEDPEPLRLSRER